MKIKILSRNPDNYIRNTKLENHRIHRNFDPSLHPFEEQREYIRALNATKLERVFAKPLIGDLVGHQDSISCLAKHPTQTSFLVSGSYNGEICVWNLPKRSCKRTILAHNGCTRAIAVTNDGMRFLSVGDDKAIKIWKHFSCENQEEDETPVNTVLSKSVLSSISYHRKDTIYATCGEVCQLWEETRNEPIKTFEWGSDNIQHVQFNLVENNLLAACTSSRSVILYDRREGKPLRKILMSMRSNSLSWNPMEAFTFTVANEDYQ